MERLLAVTLAVVVILACFMGLASNLTDKQTSRMYARAHLIEAKSAANQALLVGLMPYTILGLAVISGAVVVVIALTWPRPAPPTEVKVIEQRVIVMLQPGQAKREFWSRLEQSENVRRQHEE